MPGIDLDFNAGGMPNVSESFGPFTRNALESYWIGLGITWRFGRGSCYRLAAPDQWCIEP